MLIRHYIVDDFYNNPEQLVETAIGSAQEQTPGRDCAGVTTFPASMGQQQRDILQQVTHGHWLDSQTDAVGEITFSRQQGLLKQTIQLAASSGSKWAGVVYLSKDHPAVDGTTFWKHLRTGLEEIPKTREGLSEQGWDTKENLESFLEVDGADESLWEKTFTVPYKYNRLVLFRPWMFHSHGPAFGDTLNSSRVVQTLFLDN